MSEDNMYCKAKGLKSISGFWKKQLHYQPGTQQLGKLGQTKKIKDVKHITLPKPLLVSR